MSAFVFFIFLSIGVSFLCSILEAVILSVTPSYLASLKAKKPCLFNKVKLFKDDIEKPLASILTFNTIAHTVGAAGAGAEAQRLFGSESLAVFSAILTFGILFFSEIIPKSIGASYWRELLPFASKILGPMILLSLPVVWLSEKFSSLFKKEAPKISRDEISAMADIGLTEGAIGKAEHRSLHALIEFKKMDVSEIITPANNVFGVDENLTIKDAYALVIKNTYSRVIIFDKGKVKGYILRAQILEAYIDKSDKTIKDFIIPIIELDNTASMPQLFELLVKKRKHICVIYAEDKKFRGIITLEDLIEHMLNLEIYDELDKK